jgi:hypothetical protein
LLKLKNSLKTRARQMYLLSTGTHSIKRSLVQRTGFTPLSVGLQQAISHTTSRRIAPHRVWAHFGSTHQLCATGLGERHETVGTSFMLDKTRRTSTGQPALIFNALYTSIWPAFRFLTAFFRPLFFRLNYRACSLEPVLVVLRPKNLPRSQAFVRANP